MIEKINKYIRNEIVNDVPCIYSKLTCKNKIETYNKDIQCLKIVNVNIYYNTKKIISNFYKPLFMLLLCNFF